ncbi:flagellar hook assembly protein FlgD [Sphingosinicella sp.]|uniref:flagellar hook assembly protein FlgD n=1 Tax=Sphingosinicella sp. TaxID=1917971 RepID=UPI004037F667
MQASPITPSPAPTAPSASASVGDAASNAFGLSFESLLRIILTQLTYQDPLKPMDNFEFVSQLAQFSQLQQGQATNDRLVQLVAAAGSTQATSLLGALVDVPAGAATLSGSVTAITFADGQPRLSVQTTDGQTINDLALGAVSRIRREN